MNEIKPTASVGCIIITHCAKMHLPYCLPPLLASPLKPRILVVNSSSNDGTLELAEQFGAETLVIPRREFNHGLTREKARNHLNCDYVVMMTPDAYLSTPQSLEELLKPLFERRASIAYGRQLPHEGAGFFESFAREYNYPKESHIRSLKECERYGIYTFFSSNSFAAYKNSALDEVGGFQKVLLGEDTVIAAQLLRKGHKIAYVAEAMIHHSHSYTLKQEFFRCFDIGLARKSYSHLFALPAGDTKRGLGYSLALLSQLSKKEPLKLPYAGAHLFVKWLGYFIGNKSERAPLWLKKALSSQDFYWNS